MTLSNIPVCLVMCRRDLEHARAEVFFYRRICDNRNGSARERAPAEFANVFLVTFVVGVNRHCRVAHDRFGTGGGNFQKLALTVHDFIAHFEERALLGFHDDLFVRECRLADRTPVDHAFATVDMSLLE